MACQTSNGRLEQTSRCVVDSQCDGKFPSASAPTARCGPAPGGLEGLAAGTVHADMPRECLPTPQVLRSFLLLAGHGRLPRLISLNLHAGMAIARICSFCDSYMCRLKTWLMHLLPPRLPRHLVAHAGIPASYLIPVRQNLLPTTNFDVEVPGHEAYLDAPAILTVLSSICQ